MWLYSSSSKRSAHSPSSFSSSTRRSPPLTSSRPTSPGSALAEVLRKNPFRAGSKETLSHEDEDEDEDEDTSVSMNKDLLVLADFFPDVKTEVLRELLLRFDGDSRLPICTEQLYKYKGEWAKGRFNLPPRGLDETLPTEELFRTKAYIDAVKWTVGREFNGLSKSTIDAVLAEVNFSYTNARPTLQGLASKSWKIALTSIFKKRKPRDEAPSILLDKTRIEPGGPRLLATGSEELDRELSGLFMRPVQSREPKDQQAIDFELAHALNLKEAEEAGALFECQVCYNDVTFEDVSVCTQSDHTVCLDCVRRTLHEAIFGQGWARSVSVEHGTLKCLAIDNCDGCIPQDLVHRAALLEKSGSETWARFEDRLAEHSLRQSALPVIRCPFCSYAEAEQIYDRETASRLTWRIRKPPDICPLTFILLLELLPTILFLLIPFLLLFPNFFLTTFYTSLNHLALQSRTTRFVCRRASCSRKSCLKCLKPWHDPHVCHEPLILSLRTTVEAARTAAIKRTCPRCGTNFVKSSGCNKLTCVCGYSMCYLCRKNIGKAGSNSEGGEGYRHFCEHFRPTPGLKCGECDKCDLYQAEDEDEQVRRAGEEAERRWREKEGMVGVKGLEDAVGSVAGEDTTWRRFWRGNWTLQSVVDRMVEQCVVVDVE
ncbi:uncharacterized protein Z518_08235 [Rhinocladiella mackenziei CBS 650.93]|uniref:RING-type domain-containing protein n=1 Tax=Rhinocladiella mackenziei CBS 650.93 TaxID=1442369 RepID=A0A0D2IG99_9EURO|nr:uncharacterized protein Z518_08235 [Rhinocladiella mackenziei CBS 650.93]KIX02296.1 hypothetical protein Z518_08235 [Rhinocladiella mackenziei CBS 650.93]